MLGAERPPGIARRDPDPLPHRDDSASGAANPPPAENRPKNPPRPSTREADALWQALRAWRLEEARHQQIPPYVIFHDATLIEIARRRPTTLAALSTIPGIGRSKLDRYGEAVLAVIAEP